VKEYTLTESGFECDDQPIASEDVLQALKRGEQLRYRVEQWSHAYPETAFPEPDFKKAAQVLEDAGMTIDSISASNMRHVITRLSGLIKHS